MLNISSDFQLFTRYISFSICFSAVLHRFIFSSIVFRAPSSSFEMSFSSSLSENWLVLLYVSQIMKDILNTVFEWFIAYVWTGLRFLKDFLEWYLLSVYLRDLIFFT